MKTTTAIPLLLLLALPSVARSHPCEADLASMKKDLESIRRAVTTIEAVPPGDTRDQMLTGAKARYDLEQRRIKEAQSKCDALVAAENPGATPVQAPVTAASAPPVAAPAAPAAPTPAAVVEVAPIVETARPVAPPPAPVAPDAPVAVAPLPVATPATPPAPCLTGCGKDTDCKGDRLCVKGECVDPPAKRN